MGTQIWSYDCDHRMSEPTEGADYLHEQLRRAHRYRNVLTEHAIDSRTWYRDIRAVASEAVGSLQAKIDALSEQIDRARDSIKTERKASRKRTPADAFAKALLGELRAQRTSDVAELKAARASYTDSHRAASKAFEDRFDAALKAAGNPGTHIRGRIRADLTLSMLAEKEWPLDWQWIIAGEGNSLLRRKEARAVCGLSPGTYTLIESAIDSADPKKEPKFHRWCDAVRLDRKQMPEEKSVLEGRIGVQIQGGLLVAKALDGLSSALRIEPLPSSTWETTHGRMHAYAIVRMRIGIENGKAPIWCALRVNLHRPLPPDGDIRQAWISVRHDGRRTRYRLQLVVSAQSFARIPPAQPRVIAIDFGWRAKADSSTRVAYSVDDIGLEREYLLPVSVRADLAKADALRGFSDTHFNHARPALQDWLEKPNQSAPQWMREATEYIAQWRQHWRLVDVAERWRTELVGNEHARKLWSEWVSERKLNRGDLFAPQSEIDRWLHEHGETDVTRRLCLYLEWWRKKEVHLYDYATNLRSKAERRRSDLYRVWARQIADRYSVVLVEDTNFRSLGQKARTEDDTTDYLNRIQSDAAPGHLRRSITEAAGYTAVLMPAQNSTRQCHRCRHINTEWPHAETRVQQCASCGSEWDQDSNACRNWLDQWGEGLGGDGNAGGSRAGTISVKNGAVDGPQAEPPEASPRHRSQTDSYRHGIVDGAE